MNARDALELSRSVSGDVKTPTYKYLEERIYNTCLHGKTFLSIKYSDLEYPASTEYITPAAARLLHEGYQVELLMDRVIIKWKDDQSGQIKTY